MSNRVYPNPPPSDHGDDERPIGELREADESGYQPEPEPPRESTCAVCDEPILSVADGRNLVDPKNVRDFHIHHRCWDEIPKGQRFMLVLRIRQAHELSQALGELSQAIKGFHSLVALARDEYKRRSSEAEGAGGN